MTAVEQVQPTSNRSTLPIVDAVAPPERLAMLRILTGVFVLVYLAIRLPVFLQLGDRQTGFDPVGVLGWLDSPPASWAVPVALAVCAVSGVGYTLGWWFRPVAIVFALSLLMLTTARSSWGQLLHFENLPLLHVGILALAPAADAWSLDARRRSTCAGGDSTRHDGETHRSGSVGSEDVRYGWPVALAALVTVVTYVIAGLAKLRYGGIDWIVGDTLRNHVAYAAARLDLLGGTASPFAGWGVRNDWLWPLAAAATIAIELAAPIALLGGRIRTAWVIAAWSMHAAILAFMLILFPYPLFLVAFAPMYRVERLWTDRPGWLRTVGVGQRTD